MQTDKIYDITVIGGGIVGASSAMALQQSRNYSVLILEAEDKLAAHQTGNNSGVIHSGLYYKPGSLKAKNCVFGRELMYRFCEENNIKHEKCGKVVVANNKEEIPSLNELERRGIENGLEGIKKLSAEEIKEYEPHAAGIAGLFVPQTGIVNFTEVTETYGKLILDSGGEIKLNSKLLSIHKDGNGIVLNTTAGDFKTKFLVNCAGLQSDRIARMCSVDPKLQIIPFRGEYYKIKKEK